MPVVGFLVKLCRFCVTLAVNGSWISCLSLILAIGVCPMIDYARLASTASVMHSLLTKCLYDNFMMIWLYLYYKIMIGMYFSSVPIWIGTIFHDLWELGSVLWSLALALPQMNRWTSLIWECACVFAHAAFMSHTLHKEETLVLTCNDLTSAVLYNPWRVS